MALWMRPITFCGAKADRCKTKSARRASSMHLIIAPGTRASATLRAAAVPWEAPQCPNLGLWRWSGLGYLSQVLVEATGACEIYVSGPRMYASFENPVGVVAGRHDANFVRAIHVNLGLEN